METENLYERSPEKQKNKEILFLILLLCLALFFIETRFYCLFGTINNKFITIKTKTYNAFISLLLSLHLKNKEESKTFGLLKTGMSGSGILCGSFLIRYDGPNRDFLELDKVLGYYLCFLPGHYTIRLGYFIYDFGGCGVHQC